MNEKWAVARFRLRYLITRGDIELIELICAAISIGLGLWSYNPLLPVRQPPAGALLAEIIPGWAQFWLLFAGGAGHLWLLLMDAGKRWITAAGLLAIFGGLGMAHLWTWSTGFPVYAGFAAVMLWALVRLGQKRVLWTS
mgnify:FL=1